MRQLEPAARVLASLLELQPGHRVLDVGAGDGKVALAAAGQGVAVTACGLAPRMVELGRARTAVAGHSVDWWQADVQALPYPDASFDSVASAFGASLAPNASLAASELARVTRPGGTVAIASWIPRGLPGRLDELVGTVAPRPRPAFDRVLRSCNNLPPSVQIDARYLVAVGIRPG